MYNFKCQVTFDKIKHLEILQCPISQQRYIKWLLDARYDSRF